MSIYRETWVEVDLDAIYHNVSLIKRIHSQKALFTVVKANAYGHGDVEVAKTALEAGSDVLAVSSLDEAMNLRQSGIEAPILVLGMTRLKDVFVAAKNKISLTAHDELWINELLDLNLTAPLSVHLKLDTGMHRLGLLTKEVVSKNFKRLNDAPNILVEGIFTHMATADNDETYFKSQLNQFEMLIEGLPLSDVKYVHLSNTATLLQHQFSFDHAVRLGLGTYGLNPDDSYISFEHELKPALSLYSRLVQVKKINKGDKVGYGATYEAINEEWIGVVPIGYADGWIRAHQGRCVVIEGHECEIVGRICMDQMMVRLPYEMKMGTKVTLIGKSMSAQRIANELKTISYEVLCLISDRVPRLYRRHNEITTVRKMRFDHGQFE